MFVCNFNFNFDFLLLTKFGQFEKKNDKVEETKTNDDKKKGNKQKKKRGYEPRSQLDDGNIGEI